MCFRYYLKYEVSSDDFCYSVAEPLVFSSIFVNVTMSFYCMYKTVDAISHTCKLTLCLLHD